MARSNSSRRVGLARALSKLGHCSRSEARKLIRAGRVRLNRRLRFDPETPVHLEKDCVEVDGQRLSEETRIYLMLNKPRGLVTTASDEEGRETIYSCLSDNLPWVAPVGRLDKASEGLLLLTNDSEWGARMLAPETHLDKTYHVQMGALVDSGLIHAILAGVKAGNGDVLQAKAARILREGKRNTWLEIVLDEGKNRHIRRMFEALGAEVLRLVRVAVGPLVLGNLPKRAFRSLTATEKQALDRAMNPSAKSQAH